MNITRILFRSCVTVIVAAAASGAVSCKKNEAPTAEPAAQPAPPPPPAPPPTPPPTETPPTPPPAAAEPPAAAKVPAGLDPAKLTEKAPAKYKAKFTTTKGDFVIEVHRDWAPVGAD